MALSDIVNTGLERPVAAVRRYVISFAIAATAAVGALLYAASAMVMLLETVLGPVGARLAVAAALLVIAVAGYFAPKLLRTTAAQPEQPAEIEGLTREQRIAMVFEALILGFSMGSRKPAESTDGRK